MRMLTLIGLAALLPALSGARPLALDDYYQWQTVSDPRLSADGRLVAYALSTPDRDADADVSSIWLISRDGRDARRLSPAKSNERSPRWSPDGRNLAFLSDRAKPNSDAQIWVVDPRSGDAVQRTRFEGSIADFAWSPDGMRMVFSGVASANNETGAGGRPLPIVIDRLQFKRDFEGYLGNTRSHLYLLDLDSGAVSQLTHGLADEIQPAWSPDGASIAFLTKAGPEPDAHDNWDLFLIGARPDSTPRQLTHTPEMENDPEWGRGYGPPRFSPDGRQLAYVRGGDPKDSWYGLVQLAVSAMDGAAAQLPTSSLDRLTLDPHWSADGRWIYFLLEDDQSQLLARLRLKDGHIERLTGAAGVVSQFDVARDGAVVAVYGTSDQPSELVAIEHGRTRRLTHHNDGWVREVALATARDIKFSSADGTSVHGLLLLPAGEKPRTGWPTLVQVDGGPVSQWQHEFDFEWQYFVQQGYAVVAPNPRGSSGRGFAYQRAIFANWGFVDGPDVIASADHAVRTGLADPHRLGIGGWSYGSQLTNHIIATDSRFKAATSGAGISNMLAGYGVDQYVREWESELGLPWENTALWLRLSYAFLHADRITTPTLFLCGSEDANVPAVGAQQMYQALRRLGVPTQLVIYPGEYHSFARPGFRVDVLRRYVAWYDRYLKAD